MYLGYQGNKIKFYTEAPLDAVLYNIDLIEETQEEYALDEDEYVLKDEAWEEKQRQKERQRIQALYMTRSDFFDGMIKAFLATEEVLGPAIEGILDFLHVDNVTKLIAMNNFKNALNFYRKHTLFTLLSGVPITLGENTITITSQQWDKFFDETDKKNPEAYKELLPPEEEEEPEEEAEE